MMLEKKLLNDESLEVNVVISQKKKNCQLDNFFFFAFFLKFFYEKN
jgi:hypothetical protein